MLPRLTFVPVFFSLFTALPAIAELSDVRFRGDLRFRTENIQEEQLAPLNNTDRTRQRIRLRLGATVPVNSNTEVTARLATGSTLGSETATTNQDLTDYYAKKTIVLDLAYFDWKAGEGLNLWGGKTPLPFRFVGGNDLIFDGDLTPEGLSLRYQNRIDVAHEIFATLSATWLSERFSATGATDNTDVGLMAAQVGYGFMGDDINTLATLSHYSFPNIRGATPAAARGNTVSGGTYAQEFRVTALGLEVGTEYNAVPISLYSEAAQNADGGQYKNAVIYGLRIGRTREPQSWSFSIDHREIEKDAVLGILAESDSSGGGADIRSLRAALQYQLDKNATAGLTYYNGKKSISSTFFSANYQRMMLDFSFAF